MRSFFLSWLVGVATAGALTVALATLPAVDAGVPDIDSCRESSERLFRECLNPDGVWAPNSRPSVPLVEACARSRHAHYRDCTSPTRSIGDEHQ